VTSIARGQKIPLFSANGLPEYLASKELHVLFIMTDIVRILIVCVNCQLPERRFLEDLILAISILIYQSFMKELGVQGRNEFITTQIAILSMAVIVI
jgi:hypothetical protein